MLRFICVALLVGLAACQGSTSNNEQIVETEDVQVSILHFNDLHANLVGHWEQVRQPDNTVLVANRGGLARHASLIKTLRADNANTILVSVGDTYHGGAEAMFSNGNAIIEPVDALEIDVGVMGNWDFAYGPTVTNARYGQLLHDEILRPGYPVIAANVSYRIPAQISQPLAQNLVQDVFNYTAGEAFLPATHIEERGDLRIGFIGLTSDIVEKMHEMMAFNLEFTQGEEAYLALINNHVQTLRTQGVNLIAVLSELGIHKDFALANALPVGSVDIFFSAHTHEATFEPLQSASGALVVESGSDAYLGQMDVLFRQGKPVDYAWTLHAVDDSLTEDAEVKALVEAAREEYLLDNPAKTIPAVFPPDVPALVAAMLPGGFDQTLTHSLDYAVAYTDIPLERGHALENNFNNIFTDLLRNETGADVALTPGFRFDSAIIPSKLDFRGEQSDYHWLTEENVVLNGEITIADIYRFIPAPFHLAQGQVKGSRLKAVIEENLNAVFSPEVFEHAGGWVDGFSGLRLDLDLGRPEGERVLAMYLDGTTTMIADDQLLTIAGCARPMDQEADTTLCSYAGFENVENLVKPDSPEHIWAASDFLIRAIQGGALADVEVRRGIEDMSQTEFWPHSGFYQPLAGALPE